MSKLRVNLLVVLVSGVSVAALASGCRSGPPPGNTNQNDSVENDNSGDGEPDPGEPPITEGDWYRPSVAATWQWQLQPGADGTLNIAYDVEVYDIDLFDAPDDVIATLQAAGRRVVCYFSAGSFESFRVDAGEFQAAELGQTLETHANERWLDVRSENVRRIILARLDLAAERGCDGVEPDNVDGFANETGFTLSGDDQLAFNRFLANEAHRRNLSVALKNDLDQILELVDYFDFSVNEQCHEYDECELLDPFIDAGKPVFNAEYEARWVNSATEREELCAEALGRDLRTLVLPLDLDDSFRFSCDP
jgi:hypothetical protein